jgi:hypothetical protein
MPSVRFMVSVPSGPENLERFDVHLLPFQVERPLERLPDFPSEITVPSQWNGRNGNIVPFQSFFYIENLERRADMQGRWPYRITLRSVSDCAGMQAMGGAASEAAPMPMGRTTRHPQAIFWRRTWGGSQTMPSRLLADSGPFAGFRWSGPQDRRQPRWATLRGTEKARVSC